MSERTLYTIQWACAIVGLTLILDVGEFGRPWTYVGGGLGITSVLIGIWRHGANT